MKHLYSALYFAALLFAFAGCNTVPPNNETTATPSPTQVSEKGWEIYRSPEDYLISYPARLWTKEIPQKDGTVTTLFLEPNNFDLLNAGTDAPIKQISIDKPVSAMTYPNKKEVVSLKSLDQIIGGGTDAGYATAFEGWSFEHVQTDGTRIPEIAYVGHMIGLPGESAPNGTVIIRFYNYTVDSNNVEQDLAEFRKIVASFQQQS